VNKGKINKIKICVNLKKIVSHLVIFKKICYAELSTIICNLKNPAAEYGRMNGKPNNPWMDRNNFELQSVTTKAAFDANFECVFDVFRRI
jgi:hypothetical protein